jgi:hypothetical protein
MSRTRAIALQSRDGAWRSLVSALVWGTRGRQFESARPDWEAPYCGGNTGQSDSPISAET